MLTLGDMKILLPPLHLETLSHLSTLAVRWFARFDPFGPNRAPAQSR